MLKKIVGGLFAKKLETEFTPSLSQRRKAARRPCELSVECVAGSKPFVATVIDIGAGGMRLRADFPVALKKQVPVKVTYPDMAGRVEEPAVECTARWTRTIDDVQHFGLEFTAPKTMGRTWVKGVMKDLGFQSYNIKDQRKFVRVDCSLKATIQLGGEAVPVDVRDVGMGGFYGVVRKPLRAGASVELKVLESKEFPSAVFPVTVRHQQHPDPSSPFGYGLAFSTVPGGMEETLRDYILSRQGEGWKGSGSVDIFEELNAEIEEEDNSLDDVEIPDLQEILDSTEEEEEE